MALELAIPRYSPDWIICLDVFDGTSGKERDNEIGAHKNVKKAGEAVSDELEALEQEGCGIVGITYRVESTVGCIVLMASFLRAKVSA